MEQSANKEVHGACDAKALGYRLGTTRSIPSLKNDADSHKIVADPGVVDEQVAATKASTLLYLGVSCQGVCVEIRRIENHCKAVDELTRGLVQIVVVVTWQLLPVIHASWEVKPVFTETEVKARY